MIKLKLNDAEANTLMSLIAARTYGDLNPRDGGTPYEEFLTLTTIADRLMGDMKIDDVPSTDKIMTKLDSQLLKLTLITLSIVILYGIKLYVL